MSPKRKRKRGLPKGTKRVRLEVKPANGGWVVTENGKRREWQQWKLNAVDAATGHAWALAKVGGLVSLRIHGRDGRYQSERTYPRGSDPFPPRG